MKLLHLLAIFTVGISAIFSSTMAASSISLVPSTVYVQKCLPFAYNTNTYYATCVQDTAGYPIAQIYAGGKFLFLVLDGEASYRILDGIIAAKNASKAYMFYVNGAAKANIYFKYPEGSFMQSSGAYVISGGGF